MTGVQTCALPIWDLLRELAIKTERVAVELNLEILDRKEFDQRRLKQGDRVEILNFIGGGSSTTILRGHYGG